MGPVLATAAAKPSVNNDDDYDDDSEDTDGNTNVRSVPNLRKLDIDLEQDSASNFFTLGSLLGQAPNKPDIAIQGRRSSLDEYVDQPRRGNQ